MNVLTERKRLTVSLLQFVIGVAMALGLALLVGQLPVLVSVGVVIVTVFCVLFLQHPDQMLLLILIIRASSDLSLRYFGQIGDTVLPLGALPNIVLILTLILAGGLFILARNIPLLGLPGARLLILLLVGGLVAALRAESRLLAINEWMPVLASLVTYALAAHLFPSSRKMGRVLIAIAVSFVVPATLGFAQLIRQEGVIVFGLTVPRIWGTFVHPNPFGFYLVILITLFLVLVLEQQGVARWFAALGLAAACVLLLATFARVAWVGVAAAMLVIGVVRQRILLMVGPLVVALIFALVPPLAGRVADPFGGSFADRLVYLWPAILAQWQAATTDGGLLLVAVNRMIGLGPGMGLVLARRGYYGMSTPPHNDYLRVMVEYGIFGLINFVSLLGVLALFALKTWRSVRGTDRMLSTVSLSFLALSIAFPLMSLTDNIFGYTNNQVYFWTLAGLTAAAARLKVQSAGEQGLEASVPTGQRGEGKSLS